MPAEPMRADHETCHKRASLEDRMSTASHKTFPNSGQRTGKIWAGCRSGILMAQAAAKRHTRAGSCVGQGERATWGMTLNQSPNSKLP